MSLSLPKFNLPVPQAGQMQRRMLAFGWIRVHRPAAAAGDNNREQGDVSVLGMMIIDDEPAAPSTEELNDPSI